jgi:ankyrin repeat protein
MKLNPVVPMFVASLAVSALVNVAACSGPRPTSEISRAILAEDDAAVERLLKAGHSPEEGELRPIVWAARIGDEKAIRMLVAAGASVDRPDGRNGWTPLQHAVHKRRASAVKALLQAGADPNRHPPGGMPPLMMAAGYGDSRSFDLLLDAGANPSFEMAPGINALWAALGGGAIADITDGPPLGSCYPDIVSTIKKVAPGLRIRRDGETRVLRFLAKRGCASLIDANLS